ncbi:MAG: aminoacyl-histidine dipeptidase [Rikenellaceae bacterium]
MNKNFEALNPQSVWKHFVEIMKCPRPSHSEEKIRQYIKDFAAANGLECIEDDAHNVYIHKAATPGMESRKGLILQAHLDMVPQKNNDKEFDFESDPIEGYIDGEWVTANGTTLGADNGIGVAAILAVLEDNELVHGELEALFTATEETGMDGAMGLKGGLLKGDILLNLDSEDEGELFVGCAGGTDITATFEYESCPTPDTDYKAFKIEVKGLKGGHSGIQIVCQRANSNKILFRFLRSSAVDVDMLLCSVDGGGLRNAIPRETGAIVLVHEEDVEAFEAALKSYEADVVTEFEGIEDSISISATEVEVPEEMIDEDAAACLVWSIVGCPDGVVKMSTSMPGLVQTSSNLARVISDGSTITVQCLLRSSLRTEKEALADAIASVFELADADVVSSGSYDGWNPNMESPILKTMIASYKELYGAEPKVQAIHAGLECGIISTNYPSLDMISFGPTICYPHSPDEKVEIASVAKFYDFLKHTITSAPQK